MTTDLRDFTKRLEISKALGDCADAIMLTALRQKMPPHLERFSPFGTKAAVTAITTGVAAGIQEAFQPFVDIVTARTVLGKLRGMTVDAPPYAPIPKVIEEPDVTWTAEGAPIPMAKMSIATARTAATHYDTMWAASKELFRIGDGRARNILLRVSTRQLARGEDLKLLSDDAASGAAPAGLLADVLSSGSGSPSDLQADLENLYASVVDGRAESPVFITSGRGALYLAASGLLAFKDVKLSGGSILGAPQLVSPAAANRLILLDASELAHTDSGIEVASSEAVAVQMVDTPTPGATTLVSAFQTNVVVVKFTRYVHWTKLRDDAVGFVELPIGGSPS